MRRFMILPRDQSRAAIGTSKVSEVFDIVDRLKLGICDVDKDGGYSFSLCQTGDGAWEIFQQDEAGGMQPNIGHITPDTQEISL
jgi:hypothetical protein